MTNFPGWEGTPFGFRCPVFPGTVLEVRRRETTPRWGWTVIIEGKPVMSGKARRETDAQSMAFEAWSEWRMRT